MSKRRLLELVKSKYVTGWDDPRMPTIRGMRRLGYTPEAIRDFCERTGTAKSDSSADFALLEFCVREHLNRITDRVMAVLRPLKLVISNFPEGQVEELEAINNPEDDSAGTRMLPFAREIYIEDTDFMEDPPGKYFRLKPGGEVRLKHAYIVKCEEVVKDNSGNVTELHCSYDPETRSGGKEADRKVKGTLHWVSAKHAITAEVRLYDRLFAKENPNSVDKEGDYKENLNPNSLEVISGALVEPSLKDSEQGRHLQFLRHGYFCVDKDSSASKLVFNRTVSLRDTWAKIQKKG
jgi:glutaminyl-tRNA synthetase